MNEKSKKKIGKKTHLKLLEILENGLERQIRLWLNVVLQLAGVEKKDETREALEKIIKRWDRDKTLRADDLEFLKSLSNKQQEKNDG